MTHGRQAVKRANAYHAWRHMTSMDHYGLIFIHRPQNVLSSCGCHGYNPYVGIFSTGRCQKTLLYIYRPNWFSFRVHVPFSEYQEMIATGLPWSYLLSGSQRHRSSTELHHPTAYFGCFLPRPQFFSHVMEPRNRGQLHSTSYGKLTNRGNLFTKRCRSPKLILSKEEKQKICFFILPFDWQQPSIAKVFDQQVL